MSIRFLTDADAEITRLGQTSDRSVDLRLHWFRDGSLPQALALPKSVLGLREYPAFKEYFFLENAGQYWTIRHRMAPGSQDVCVVFPHEGERLAIQPPVFLVSPPKAGTHLVIRLLEEMGYGYGGLCPLNPQPATFYSLFHPSFHAEPVTPLNELNEAGPLMGGRLLPISAGLIVALFRDPVALVASALDYEFDPQKSVLGHATYADFEARTESFLEDAAMHGQRLPYLNRFAEWLRFPSCFPLAFEELSEPGSPSQIRAIGDLQLALGVQGSATAFAAAAWGDSATYQGGDALGRIPIALEAQKRIRQRTSYYSRMTGPLVAGETDWSHRRQATRRPVDTRPVDMDIQLEKSARYVTFYRNRAVVARLMDIDADPSEGVSTRYPFLQATFESLDRARAWINDSERIICSGLADLEDAIAAFHAARQ